MAASLIAREAGVDPVNILLVDDQPSRLLTYQTVLGELRENLIEASSGTEALKLLMTYDFAVILLDVNMPIMDGFEVASLIHQHPRFEKTPIIFITAVNVSDLDRMRGYRLGAFDYVMVPIIPEILRSKVIVLTELYRKRRELELANRRLATANEALRVEKARELGELNNSLRDANAELGNRNAELHAEIAERVRVEERLLDQDKRKDEFLAVLAHELRNPLAAVASAAEAFRLIAPTAERLHDIIARQLALLVRLIDDLLDVARIRRGKMILREGTTSLYAILDAAIETAMPQLAASDHRLAQQRLVDDIPLHADRDRLAQVFSNLIGNAAKYSHPGSTIQIESAVEKAFIEVSVTDQGIGLSSEQKAWIFELFAQVDTAVERTRGGLGIGLTLARKIIEMHRGQIVAESPGLGMGSRFIVRLPMQAIDAPAQQIVGEDDRAGEHCRVLVVDDNADAADTLRTLLELFGHTVRCIYHSTEAIAAVDEFVPDLVFLDIGMPGLSGYDVARQIRSNAAGEKLVLVALTGWGTPEDRRRTSESGFDFHLVKPASAQAIQALCRRERP